MNRKPTLDVSLDLAPSHVTVRAHRDGSMAVGVLGPVTVFPITTYTGRALSAPARTANRDLGQLVQIGQRLVNEARRAGHQHRTALRTRLLREALEATAAA